MADTSTLFPCCISICEPDSSTDLEYVINSGLGNTISCPEKFVVEFGTEKPIILLTPGQRISVGQIIGYKNQSGRTRRQFYAAYNANGAKGSHGKSDTL